MTLALGLVLLGALGLGIDAANLYGHFQLDQAAADAAAQAAVLSIFSATNTGANAFGATTGTLVCSSTTAAKTPCAYAITNGFGVTGSGDTVTVTYPCSVPGVTLSPDYDCSTDAKTPAVHVVISRSVGSTFLRLLGAGATTIKASATAALVQENSPIPIIVTHPTLAPSLNMQGSGKIMICGGPSQSIQVNSTGKYPSPADAFQRGGSETVDLSLGGPADSAVSPCTTGTGSLMGVFGGPSSTTTNTTTGVALVPFADPKTAGCLTANAVCIGSTGNYKNPNLPLDDPLLQVPYPTPPANTYSVGDSSNIPNTSDYNQGTQDCPPSCPQPVGTRCSAKPCVRYYPGVYPNGIQAQNNTIVFQPGVYYITGSPSSGTFRGQGLAMGSNGGMIMCGTNSGTNYCTADTGLSGCCGSVTNPGMLIYLTASGGTVNLGANSDSSLVGSDSTSSYKGILIFVNRGAPTQVHQLGGGNSTLTLKGTIYATNTKPAMLASQGTYQTINLQGGGSSGTLVQGEIITSALTTSGGGSITMQLNPNFMISVNKVALVQ